MERENGNQRTYHSPQPLGSSASLLPLTISTSAGISSGRLVESSPDSRPLGICALLPPRAHSLLHVRGAQLGAHSQNCIGVSGASRVKSRMRSLISIAPRH